jgi:hypothetical protein
VNSRAGSTAQRPWGCNHHRAKGAGLIPRPHGFYTLAAKREAAKVYIDNRAGVIRAIRDLWALKKLSPTAIFSLYASLIHRYHKRWAEIDAEFAKVSLAHRDALANPLAP